MSEFGHDIYVAMPEIIISVVALIVVFLGSLYKNDSRQVSAYLAIIAFTSCIIWIEKNIGFDQQLAFNEFYISNLFRVIAKYLVLFSAIVIMIVYSGEILRKKMDIAIFEFPVIVLLVVIGMLVSLSANDFLILYLGIELQSLGLYILTSFERDNLKSNEAGMKYFIMGAVASAILLFGISMIYGFSGSTNFNILAELFATESYMSNYNVAILVGLIFVIIGLAFKLSAVPFHMWTPDVYQGSPNLVTMMLATMSKITSIGIVVILLTEPFSLWFKEWKQIIYFLSVASMIVGAIAGVNQQNIKRLLAYSSITHVGFMLIGLVIVNNLGISSLTNYLMIYVVITIGIFSLLIMLKRNGVSIENIEELKSISRTNKFISFAIATLMFSLAGIPPFAGFYAKLYILQAAVTEKLYSLVFVGILSSVISAYYYLKIVKVMYFDESDVQPIDNARKRTRFIAFILVSVNLFYCLLL